MRRPLYRYSVTTFDPRAAWWCGHHRTWGSSYDSDGRQHNYGSHRPFRTLKQALAHATVLLLRGMVDVFVLENGRTRREWCFATTVPGDGLRASRSIAWARAYLATPRRKR